MQWRWIVVVCGLVAYGCGAPKENAARQESASATSSAESAKPAQSGESRNGCRLLTADELKAIEPSVVLGNVVAEEPTYSECIWEDKDGIALIGLKVYWEGGREQWEIWRQAQGLGEQIFQQEEGVGLHSIVKQGLVPGLGDSAYFSPLLPSLLLKGDVLVEIDMPTVENPEAKLRPLATKLLSRI